MVVANGLHFWPRLKDAGVNEPLAVWAASIALQLLAFQVVRLEVVLGNQLRRAGPRHDVAVRMLRMANAHMTEGVEDAMMRQDAVGNDELAQQIVGGWRYPKYLLNQARARSQASLAVAAL